MEWLSPGGLQTATEAFEAHVFGLLRDFDLKRGAIDVSDFAAYIVERDDTIGIGRFDFDAVSGDGDVVDRDTRGAVETTTFKGIHDSGEAAIGGANHVPAHVHIFAE